MNGDLAVLPGNGLLDVVERALHERHGVGFHVHGTAYSIFDGLCAFPGLEIDGEVPVAYAGDRNVYKVFRGVCLCFPFFAGNGKEDRGGSDQERQGREIPKIPLPG